MTFRAQRYSIILSLVPRAFVTFGCSKGGTGDNGSRVAVKAVVRLAFGLPWGPPCLRWVLRSISGVERGGCHRLSIGDSLSQLVERPRREEKSVLTTLSGRCSDKSEFSPYVLDNRPCVLLKRSFSS